MYHFDGSSSESDGESESNSLSKYLLNRESLVASENDDFLLPEDNYSSEQYEIDFDQLPQYDQENIYMNSTLNTKRLPLSSLHNRINTQTDSFQSNLNVSMIPFSSTQLASNSRDNSITQFVQSKIYEKEELKQMIEDEVDDPKIAYISNNGAIGKPVQFGAYLSESE